MNISEKIMRFEDGLMTRDEVIVFVQELVDSGMAWRLQGAYGRLAAALIDSGEVIDTHNALDLGRNDCE